MNNFYIRAVLLILVLLAFDQAFAAGPINGIEVPGTDHGTKVRVEEVCLNGLSFAIASVGILTKQSGVSIIQIFVTTNTTTKPQPKKCTK